MDSSPRQPPCAWFTAFATFAAFGVLLLGMVAASGCAGPSTSDPDSGPADAKTPGGAPDKGKSAAEGDKDKSDKDKSDKDKSDKDKGDKTGREDGVKASAALDFEKGPLVSPSQDSQKVLEAMVDVYRKASSYHDRGKLAVTGIVLETKQPIEQGGGVDYSVDFKRPNTARIIVNGGVILCDGKQFVAYTSNMSGQYLQREAPAELTFQSCFDDPSVYRAIEQGPAVGVSVYPLQMVLLLAKAPLKTLLFNAKEPPKLLPPEKIGARTCNRIELVRLDGKVVLWIDAEDHLLRRLELPVDARAAKADGLDVRSAAIDFTDAEIGLDIAPESLKFEAPKDSQACKELMPSPVSLLGKTIPDFSFTAAGKKIDPKALSGKVAVLDFWATWCEPCRTTLPVLERVYRKYKDNPKVTFLAVSVDKPEVADADIEKVLKELDVTMPRARDSEQTTGSKLKVVGLPTTYIVGSDGRVQGFEIGPSESRLVGLIDQVLAGKDVFGETLKLVEQDRKQHKTELQNLDERGIYAGIARGTVEPTPIAAKTDPKAFTLEPLWKNTEIKSPANLLVTPQPSGPPRAVVAEGGRNLTELDLAKGTIVATHPMDIDKQEVADFFRTATDASGNRYYVAAARGMPRIHVFDGAFKRVFSFPENALQPDAGNPGISDVQLADFDGDGKLELCVAYHGDVGVQGVSLEGKRMWSNRTIVANGGVKTAVLAPDAQKKRSILCAIFVPSLPILDHKGDRAGDISVPGHEFSWIAAEDLHGDGKLDVCGIYEASDNQRAVAGVGTKGDVLWNYLLPKGMLWGPVEQLVAGRVFAEGPGQWIVPFPDGSIHVLAADGKLVEAFNYGALLTGLATASLDGKPVLIVASKDSLDEKDQKCAVTAFRIVPAARK